MIIIKSTISKKTGKKLFHVDNTAGNNEILKPSESFPTKQAAWKNIIADAKENYYGCTHVFVMDRTVKKPCGYWYSLEDKTKILGERKDEPVKL